MINILKKKYSKPIYWKRPHEIVSNPKFIVNGIDPNDLSQGNTGNCWFIAAASSLMTIPSLAKHVIPFDQSFDNTYAGIFHFRFWQFGEWVDVVIDDRLPFSLETNNLMFCRNSKQQNEFWAPLLVL